VLTLTLDKKTALNVKHYGIVLTPTKVLRDLLLYSRNLENSMRAASVSGLPVNKGYQCGQLSCKWQ